MLKRHSVLHVVLLLLVSLVVATPGAAAGPFAGEAPAKPKPKLIKHGWDMPSPGFVRRNVAALERLPFDGITVAIPGLGTKVQRQTPVSYAQFRAVLEPHRLTKFTDLKYNFAATYATPAGSYFDDYTVPIQNFANLARAARATGFRGIMYDNEEYFGRVNNYPGSCPGRTLLQCQAQARLRGRQVMDAMRAVWPDIEVMALYGAWASEPKTLDALTPGVVYNDVSGSVDLLGSFVIGLVESAAGTAATVIDGGEIYTARTHAQFAAVNAWQNAGMAAKSTLVPAALRPRWSATVSAAFGVYDREWIGVPMDVNAWQSTVTNALNNTDEYVWLYTEEHDWLGSGWPRSRVPSSWVTATRNAKAAAG